MAIAKPLRRLVSRSRLSRLEGKPLWLLFPALVVLALVQIYPTLFSYYLSLGQVKAGKYSYVGLENFRLLLRNSDFYESLGRTAVFTASYLVLCIGLGMVLALLLNRRNRMTPLYMTVIFIPMVMSEVVAGTMWRWLFQQSFGLAQVALNPLLNNVSLLSSPWGAMAIVIAASVWRALAFTALLFLGALQTVPHEVYESSALDGANRWQSFWKITLPIIRPTLLIAVIMTSIRGINSLGLILATTKGGPGAATMTTAVYLYRQAWQFGDFGTAASLSVIMFVVNVVLAVVYIRILRSK
jgi:multiple sugar transport system permease protein